MVPVEPVGAVVVGPAATAVVVVALVAVAVVVAGWEGLVTVERLPSRAVVVAFEVAFDPLLQAPTSNAITTRPPRHADIGGEPTPDGARTTITLDANAPVILSPNRSPWPI